MNILVNRLRERLLALGHDPSSGGQTWLASQVGMKPQGIQSILAGDVRRPRQLVEIARVLQTSPEYLLGEVEDAHSVVTTDRRMAVRLADLFADLMRAPIDLQHQVASQIESRLKRHQFQSRQTETKQAS